MEEVGWRRALIGITPQGTLQSTGSHLCPVRGREGPYDRAPWEGGGGRRLNLRKRRFVLNKKVSSFQGLALGGKKVFLL